MMSQFFCKYNAWVNRGKFNGSLTKWTLFWLWFWRAGESPKLILFPTCSFPPFERSLLEGRVRGLLFLLFCPPPGIGGGGGGGEWRGDPREVIVTWIPVGVESIGVLGDASEFNELLELPKWLLSQRFVSFFLVYSSWSKSKGRLVSASCRLGWAFGTLIDWLNNPSGFGSRRILSDTESHKSSSPSRWVLIFSETKWAPSPI